MGEGGGGQYECVREKKIANTYIARTGERERERDGDGNDDDDEIDMMSQTDRCTRFLSPC